VLRRIRNVRPLVVLLGILLLAGCGSSETQTTARPGGVAAGMCLRGVMYKGTLYVGGATKVAPTPAESLGTGQIPPCGDVVNQPTGKSDDTKGEDVSVSAVEGISPDVAIVRDGEADTLYVRQDVMSKEQLPAEVDRLLSGERERR
jgi:hypothetical protein